MNTRRDCTALVALLMIAHAMLLLFGVRRNFVVVDEMAHIPAGLSHWKTGDFSLYRVNPPLGRMLAALPVLAAHPDVDLHRLDPTPGSRADVAVGWDFADRNAGRYLALVGLARLAGIAWSLLGAWLIYCWGRALYGAPAGCLATALWCVDPTVLAFAQVVTPDIPSTVAALAATYAFWHYLRGGTWPRAVVAGLLLGIAQLTKFTLLVLYVVWPWLWLLQRPGQIDRKATTDSGEHGRRGRLAGQAAVILLIGLEVINFGYGFSGTFRPLGEYTFISRLFAGERSLTFGSDRVRGNRFAGGPLEGLIVPLPSEYLQGIDAQRKDFESGFSSYLRGEWRTVGWWYYYLYALAVKEPLGTWALVLWGLGLTLFRHSAAARAADELALLLPAGAILVFVSSQTGFNHHMRYILPISPFLAVATGKLAWYFGGERRRFGGVVLTLLAWSAASSLAVVPHSMSYFNEAAGGPMNGGAHLVDSNVDWGQDLLSLRRWLEAHPEARPLGLAYFNVLDPRLVGIDYTLAPLGPGEDPRHAHSDPRELGPRPGYYAVSVNYLRGSTYTAPDGRGGWRGIVRRDAFTYFRRFRPIGRAGYSIFIYRITPEQAEAERRRLGLPALDSLQDDSASRQQGVGQDHRPGRGRAAVGFEERHGDGDPTPVR